MSIVTRILVLLACFSWSAAQSEGLKVGDKAPDFELRDQNGEMVRLSDFEGKKNVVLAFYVLAFTGGWTLEFQRYQADIDFFRQNDTEILAISVDAAPSQKKFAEELGAEFRFLGDFPEKQVSRLYGVLSDRGMAMRTTFLVDKERVIRRIDTGRDAMDIQGLKSSCAELR